MDQDAWRRVSSCQWTYVPSATSTYAYDRADRLGSITAPPLPGNSIRPPSTNDAGWSSGANAYVSDNLYATSAPAKNATTAIKIGTFGFNASVPANATITGVTVNVEWKVSTTASIATLGAQAYVGGSAVGSELVNSAEPTSDTTQSFSVSGLTRAQLLDGVFEIRVRATRGNSNQAFTASLDLVSVRVDYTTPQVTSVTVDANGNLTAKGTNTFAYDQPNRLKTATVAGAGETYAYDGDGTRFSRQVGANPAIRYVSDVNASLPVTLDDGTHKYVWGLGLAYAVSGSGIEIYHADRLGSTRLLTDATGTISATYRTDEWGVATSQTGSSTQPFGYTGEPRDATGLTYLRARYYDPSLGRFMSRDTWEGNPTLPMTLNRCPYTLGNPATATDPSGHFGTGMRLQPGGNSHPEKSRAIEGVLPCDPGRLGLGLGMELLGTIDVVLAVTEEGFSFATLSPVAALQLFHALALASEGGRQIWEACNDERGVGE